MFYPFGTKTIFLQINTYIEHFVLRIVFYSASCFLKKKSSFVVLKESSITKTPLLTYAVTCMLYLVSCTIELPFLI